MPWQTKEDAGSKCAILGSSGLAIAGYGVLMKVGSGPSVLCFDGASVLIGTLGTGCLASLRISASEEVEEDEEC